MDHSRSWALPETPDSLYTRRPVRSPSARSTRSAGSRDSKRAGGSPRRRRHSKLDLELSRWLAIITVVGALLLTFALGGLPSSRAPRPTQGPTTQPPMEEQVAVQQVVSPVAMAAAQEKLARLSTEHRQVLEASEDAQRSAQYEGSPEQLRKLLALQRRAEEVGELKAAAEQSVDQLAAKMGNLDGREAAKLKHRQYLIQRGRVPEKLFNRAELTAEHRIASPLEAAVPPEPPNATGWKGHDPGPPEQPLAVQLLGRWLEASEESRKALGEVVQLQGHATIRGVLSRREAAQVRANALPAAQVWPQSKGVLKFLQHSEALSQENEPTESEEHQPHKRAFKLAELSAGLKFLANSKRLVDIASAVLGTSQLRLYHDIWTVKSPGDHETGWAADLTAAPFETERMVTISIAVVDQEPEMGLPQFATKSHRTAWSGWDIEDSRIAGSFQISSPGYLAAGDATVHLGWTIHRSSANLGGWSSETVALSYVADGTPTIRLEDFNTGRLSSDHTPSYGSWLHDSIPGEAVSSPEAKPPLIVIHSNPTYVMQVPIVTSSWATDHEVQKVDGMAADADAVASSIDATRKQRKLVHEPDPDLEKQTEQAEQAHMKIFQGVWAGVKAPTPPPASRAKSPSSDHCKQLAETLQSLCALLGSESTECHGVKQRFKEQCESTKPVEGELKLPDTYRNSNTGATLSDAPSQKGVAVGHQLHVDRTVPESPASLSETKHRAHLEETRHADVKGVSSTASSNLDATSSSSDDRREFVQLERSVGAVSPVASDGVKTNASANDSNNTGYLETTEIWD